MATLRRRISHLARRRPAAPPVHFHQGPQGSPAPCFDTGCSAPRLDI